jgi:hypothetical protein
MRRRRIRAVAVTALTVAAGLLVSVHQASANVGVTQKVSMVGDKPVSGRYDVSFTNYGERVTQCLPPYNTGSCVHFVGYRVARGKLQTKLTTYKLSERIRKYDYYLLDVDTLVGKHSGSSHEGPLTVTVATYGAKLVDRTETKSISAQKDSCATVDLSISTPWPGVTASTGLGSVRFCDDHASFTRKVLSSNTTRYTANRLARTNHLTINRWVKVPRGAHPSFSVSLDVPADKCTSSSDGWCKKYDNRTIVRLYSIHTTG